ncbi:MAG: DPP IV N-terminal domain-containing protein [Bacteroidota bacterium]
MMNRRISLLAIGCMLVSMAYAQQPITFDHIFDGTFSPKRVQNVRWMNDGEFYTATEGQQIVRFSILDGARTVLFDGATFTSSERPNGIFVQGYQFSADEKKLLIRTDVERLWRRSSREYYYIYDREAETLTRLTEGETKQQYAQFSPKGDKVAFVRENNLFWVDLSTGQETQITTDGVNNEIINGAADWVYEEEYGFAKAWFWSPKGDRIAFYRFDERRVNEFFMTSWGTLYPGQVQWKYPKAGEENSVVTIHVYDITTKATATMDIGEETDQYIPRVNWTKNNDVLAIRRMNRLQNQQDLLFANATSGDSDIMLTETSTAWIDEHDNLKFLDNGKQFITTSEKDGYNHVYLYDMNGKELRQITKGDWEVTRIIGYNDRNGFLYYLSTEVSPLQRQFYKIRVDGKRKRQMTEGEGTFGINMSKDFKYYIQTHVDYNQPAVTTLHRENQKVIQTIEDNTELTQKLEEFQFQLKEYFTVDVNGTALNGYMIKPADFDSTQQYPVLMHVYGGPGSQTVTRSFDSGQNGMWHQHLVSNGYIIISVDNRGTGARGHDFEKQTYKQLGKYETEDQVAAARYVASLPFVDADRIGIWGWSYGGYMSTNALADGNDVFSMAIAVAPVTHWRFYDTIYTERFMQTPQLNPDGYDDNAPLSKAARIKGDYLLVHGTGDDNVHFQNAVEMVNALVAANVQFDTMFYPNRNHGIYGGNTRRHLFRMLTDYVMEKL